MFQEAEALGSRAAGQGAVPELRRAWVLVCEIFMIHPFHISGTGGFENEGCTFYSKISFRVKGASLILKYLPAVYLSGA